MDRSDDAVIVVVDVIGTDLSAVDALARLQLAAQHLGWSLRVRNASDELCEVIELVGLTGDLALPAELSRQSEDGEQLVGIEEAVEPADPPA